MPKGVVAVLFLLGCAANPGPRTPAEVRPATLVWDVGINEKDGPSPLVETILPATYKGKEVWRIVHRDPDPTADGSHNSYDMYDVDRKTLVPVRSIMDREGFHLELTFDGDKVTIEKREGQDHAKTEVRVQNPMPEGPGEAVLLAALPLRPGYTTSFPIVNRWPKDETSRVAWIDLVVSEHKQIRTRMGTCDVLEVVLTPRDASFRIRNWVRAKPPHYPVKTEYTRGDLFLVSEVTRMVLADRSESCSP
jgi:hypothetical protein